jgi:RNA polymerase sigma-70 factor (ECF subfamily)
VRAALRRLPLDHQIGLELCYWERLEETELAHVLRLPKDRVSQHLRLGREMLRHELANGADNALDTMTNLVALEASDDGTPDRPASEG